MGYKSKIKHIRQARKRQTTTLFQVIGTNLLTAKEKMISGECTGLYGLTKEDAYFKCPGDPSSLTISAFERRLKRIDPNFSVVPCDLVTNSISLQGHSIYYHVPAYEGYVKVCNVGRNREFEIPANSQGSIAKYKGTDFTDCGLFDEKALLYRGWVAAEEVCKNAYMKWEDEGISPAQVINSNEIHNYRKAFRLVGAEEGHKQLEKVKAIQNAMLEKDNIIINSVIDGYIPDNLGEIEVKEQETIDIPVENIATGE